MQKTFCTANATMKIGNKIYFPLLTSLRELTKKIKLQGGMPGSNLSIVVCHSLITTGMKGKTIDSTFFYTISKNISIKAFSYIRYSRHCMIIIKKTIFWLKHDLLF